MGTVTTYTDAVTDTTTSFPTPFVDALGQSYAGTVALYDFTQPLCNPNADGALAAGAKFNNAVTYDRRRNAAQPGALITGSGANPITSVAGKAGLSFVTGAGWSVDFGRNYDIATADEFWASWWFKLPATGYSTANYGACFKSAGPGNANQNELYWDFGNGGLQLRTCTISGSNGVYLNDNVALTPGKIYHAALRLVPAAGMAYSYLNGVQTATATGIANPMSPSTYASSYNLSLSSYFTGTVYRVKIEDTTIALTKDATKTAVQAILNEYNANQNAARIAAGLAAFA